MGLQRLLSIWSGAGKLHQLWAAAGRSSGAASEAQPAGGPGLGTRGPREPLGEPDGRAGPLRWHERGDAASQSQGAGSAPPETGVSCQGPVKAGPQFLIPSPSTSSELLCNPNYLRPRLNIAGLAASSASTLRSQGLFVSPVESPREKKNPI